MRAALAASEASRGAFGADGVELAGDDRRGGKGGAAGHLAQGEDAGPHAAAAHDLAQGADVETPGRPEPAAADEGEGDQPDEMRGEDDRQRAHHHGDADGHARQRVPLQPLAAGHDQAVEDSAGRADAAQDGDDRRRDAPLVGQEGGQQRDAGRQGEDGGELHGEQRLHGRFSQCLPVGRARALLTRFLARRRGEAGEEGDGEDRADGGEEERGLHAEPGDQHAGDERRQAEGDGRTDVEDEGEGAHPLRAGVRGQVRLRQGERRSRRWRCRSPSAPVASSAWRRRR